MLEAEVCVPGVSAGRKEGDGQGEVGALVALGPHLHPTLGCISYGTPTLQRGMDALCWLGLCPSMPPGVLCQDAQCRE